METKKKFQESIFSVTSICSECSGREDGDLIYVRYHSHKFILNEYLINAIKLHGATSEFVTFQYSVLEDDNFFVSDDSSILMSF